MHYAMMHYAMMHYAMMKPEQSKANNSFKVTIVSVEVNISIYW